MAYHIHVPYNSAHIDHMYCILISYTHKAYISISIYSTHHGYTNTYNTYYAHIYTYIYINIVYTYRKLHAHTLYTVCCVRNTFLYYTHIVYISKICNRKKL
jgi:hypothetical protein